MMIRSDKVGARSGRTLFLLGIALLASGCAGSGASDSVVKVKALDPEMAVLPGGSFTMGAPANTYGTDPDERPPHEVQLRSFALGKFLVTRGEFAQFVAATGHDAGERCMGWNGHSVELRSGWNYRSPGFEQTDLHPVVCVSWNDATAYVAWLAARTGKPFRLPSEAELEYAARGGTSTARFWGDDEERACLFANVLDQSAVRANPDAKNFKPVAHGCDDGFAYTSPVGQLRPNPWQLYDILGNVWEWTQDCYHGSYVGAPANESAWMSGDCESRVNRGGTWINGGHNLRATKRHKNLKTDRSSYLGFRVAMDLS